MIGTEMNEKIRIVDEYGTVMEVTIEGDFLRFATDADHVPQHPGVWLPASEVEKLIISLAGLLVEKDRREK